MCLKRDVSFLVGLRAVVWSRRDGALVKPAKVGDALGRFWAGSPFFLDFHMLSVSLAQTELESTGVIDARWCLAAGLAATLDVQKDKLEVVPELLFSGRCPSYTVYRFPVLLLGCECCDA